MAGRSPLNSSQARRLLALLTDVDERLSPVEALCAGRSSPFVQERADVAPEEGRLLTSFAAAARARMREACDRLGVKRPEPTISGRRSIETTLHFAGISFSELSPGRMRGYGPLAPGAEDELAALSGALAPEASPSSVKLTLRSRRRRQAYPAAQARSCARSSRCWARPPRHRTNGRSPM